VVRDGAHHQNGTGAAWAVKQDCRELLAFGGELDDIPELLLSGSAINIEHCLHFIGGSSEPAIHRNRVKLSKDFPVRLCDVAGHCVRPFFG
jgi:hypothetical protein